MILNFHFGEGYLESLFQILLGLTFLVSLDFLKVVNLFDLKSNHDYSSHPNSLE